MQSSIESDPSPSSREPARLRAEHGAVVGRRAPTADDTATPSPAEPAPATPEDASPSPADPADPAAPDTRGADDPPPSTTTNGLSSSPGATSTDGLTAPRTPNGPAPARGPGRSCVTGQGYSASVASANPRQYSQVT